MHTSLRRVAKLRERVITYNRRVMVMEHAGIATPAPTTTRLALQIRCYLATNHLTLPLRMVVSLTKLTPRRRKVIDCVPPEYCIDNVAKAEQRDPERVHDDRRVP